MAKTKDVCAETAHLTGQHFVASVSAVESVCWAITADLKGQKQGQKQIMTFCEECCTSAGSCCCMLLSPSRSGTLRSVLNLCLFEMDNASDIEGGSVLEAAGALQSWTAGAFFVQRFQRGPECMRISLKCFAFT